MSAEYDWILSQRYMAGIISIIYDRQKIHSRDLMDVGHNYKSIKDSA